MEFEAEIKSYGFKSQQNGGAFAASSKILLFGSDRNCAAFSARLQFVRVNAIKRRFELCAFLSSHS